VAAQQWRCALGWTRYELFAGQPVTLLLLRFNRGAKLDPQSLCTKVHQVLGELRKQIPEPGYRVLYMHWIEGRTMAEIAILLDLPIESVWAHHHYTKDKFRSLFEHHREKGAPEACVSTNQAS
jgi:hypothetical protein